MWRNDPNMAIVGGGMSSAAEAVFVAGGRMMDRSCRAAFVAAEKKCRGVIRAEESLNPE